MRKHLIAVAVCWLMQNRRFLVLTALFAAGCASNSGSTTAPPVNVPSHDAAIEAAAPPVVHDVALEPLGEATCVLRDTQPTDMLSLALSFEGRTFASFTGGDKVEETELRATSKAATLTVTTSEFVLTGEVHADRLDLMPRARSLRDGWLDVRVAKAKRVIGDTMEVSVYLPSIVKPVAPLALSFACRDLRLGRQFAEVDGKQVWFKSGLKTPLRATPTGHVVAEIETPLSERFPSSAVEMAREGRLVKVRLPNVSLIPSTIVEGWVELSSIGGPPPRGLNRSDIPPVDLAEYESAAKRAAPPVLRCAHEVPVFVRVDGPAVRVGFVRPNAPVRRLTSDANATEVGIDLGDSNRSGPNALLPFVRTTSLEGCTRS